MLNKTSFCFRDIEQHWGQYLGLRWISSELKQNLNSIWLDTLRLDTLRLSISNQLYVLYWILSTSDTWRSFWLRQALVFAFKKERLCRSSCFFYSWDCLTPSTIVGGQRGRKRWDFSVFLQFYESFGSWTAALHRFLKGLKHFRWFLQLLQGQKQGHASRIESLE